MYLQSKFMLCLVILPSFFIVLASCGKSTNLPVASLNPAKENSSFPSSTPPEETYIESEIDANNIDLIPAIMIDNKLFTDSGRYLDLPYSDYISLLEDVGHILKNIPQTSLPSSNNESNAIAIGSQVYIERTQNGNVEYAYIKEPNSNKWYVFQPSTKSNMQSLFVSKMTEGLFFLRVNNFILTSHGYYIDADSFNSSNWEKVLLVEQVTPSTFWKLENRNQVTLLLDEEKTNVYIKEEKDIITSAYVYDDSNQRYYFFENYLVSNDKEE